MEVNNIIRMSSHTAVFPAERLGLLWIDANPALVANTEEFSVEEVLSALLYTLHILSFNFPKFPLLQITPLSII